MTDVIERRVALRGAALEVMRRRDGEVLICGPAGTGKSYVALYKVHLMLMLNPGMRALAVRKTHRSLSSTGLVTFREQVAADTIATGDCWWYGGSGEKPAQYNYSNGSVLVVGGLDQPMKIMSSEYDLIYGQEATEFSINDLELMSSRLRNGKVSFQQLLLDCNPQQPTHPLKKRCDDGKTVMLYSHHEDNPRLFERAPDGALSLTEYGAAYIARLDALTGVRRLRLRHGKWAAAEGIIYEGWRPDVHLSDRKILPKDWTRIWAVDFGYVHPFVWQQWAIDDDGRMWLEKEIYRTKRLVEDHARAILAVVCKPAELEKALRGMRPDETWGDVAARVPWRYPKPRAIICDHDAEDRATLEKHLAMGTVPAWKTVSDGIQNVQKRLRVLPNGLPHMLVLRDSLVEVDVERKEAGKPTCFAEEIEGYVWKPPPAAVNGREKPLPDEPEKLDDDSMDTARYAAAFQDLAPTPRVRWL